MNKREKCIELVETMFGVLSFSVAFVFLLGIPLLLFLEPLAWFKSVLITGGLIGWGFIIIFFDFGYKRSDFLALDGVSNG